MSVEALQARLLARPLTPSPAQGDDAFVCGLGGVVFGNALADPQGVGRAMAQAIAHRGPDGEGVHVLPDNQGVLAHRRLAILDLDPRSNQPFLSQCRRLALVFNGEIYDFRSYRLALEARGRSFVTESDTEVVLAQYEEYGVAGLDALDGMFAYALWDGERRELILGRDRMGKKPLYWWRRPEGGYAFGSEVKAIAKVPGFERRPNLQRLPELLSYGYVSTPHSFFEGVSRLPPASRLHLRADAEPQLYRTWSLPPPSAVRRSIGVEDAKATVRSVMKDAVRRRLVSDVPLGAFLSGGVDSSIVVAEMAWASSEPVRTFCVGFEGDKTWDERPYARSIAEQFQTQHTEIVVDASPVGLLEKLLYHHDEPYGDSSALAVYAVAKATQEHVSVVLTGDGGDEVFAGYTRFLGGVLSGMVPSPMGRGLHAVLRRLPEPRGYKNPLALARRFTEHAKRSHNEQLLAWNAFFAGPALEALLRPDAMGPSFDPWAPLASQVALLSSARRAGADRLDQILRHNLRTYLLDDLLVKTDRMTMATSLEARSPFLDTKVVEAAFALPSKLKMRRGSLKWLLREAYRDTLGPDILDRKKHGFGVPLSGWWSGALAPMVDDLLLSDSARCHAWLDASVLKRMVDEHRGGVRDHGQRIFVLLQLELWLRA